VEQWRPAADIRS